MSLVEYPYAGLILPDSQDLDPGPYLDTAAKVLARLDAIPGAVPHRSAHGSKVLGRRYGVVVVPEEDSDYGPKMVIEVITVNGEMPDEEKGARILSDVALACLDHSSADILEWYSPDVLLDRDDFIRLRSYVSPRRMIEVDEETEDALFENENITQGVRDNLYGAPTPVPLEERPTVTDRLARYRITMAPQSPERRRLSAAGYLIAGALGVIYFPIAVFIYVISLARGIDFRLVSQAVAITALFAALYNADRLGRVIGALVN